MIRGQALGEPFQLVAIGAEEVGHGEIGELEILFPRQQCRSERKFL